MKNYVFTLCRGVASSLAFFRDRKKIGKVINKFINLAK